MKNSVCVFCSYEIHFHCDYSYLDEYGDICSDKVDKVYTCEGGRLMKTIIRLISDNLLISFSYDNDTLFVEYFDPNYGTGANYMITINKVVKNN